MRLSSTRRIQAIVILLFTVAVAYAKVTGPDAGYTGAPSDLGTCVACHDTFHEANVGPGSVQINNLPEIYEPGKQYTISVTTRQSGRNTFGFQITALDSSNKRAGALDSLDSTTQLNPETGFGGRQYVEHTQLGTSAPVAGSRTWQVRWTAPSTDIGAVRFFVAANAANNDGTNQNDYIYTNAASTDSATSHVTVTLLSNPGGSTLEAASIYRIDWSTTGQSNINNIEARYSTDDGATFPISNLIVSTTDASMSSFDWTVPNKPTTKARIRISVGKKSGDEATPATSEVFAISGDGSGSLPPAIFGVSASGKKLFVSGENFMMGAVIEVNEVEKATVNDEEDFSHMLRSKKGAKKIKPGQTASITVLNPDNQRSEPFMFTRPPE